MNRNTNGIRLSDFAITRHHRILFGIGQIREVYFSGDLRIQFGIRHQRKLGVQILQVRTERYFYINDLGYRINNGCLCSYRYEVCSEQFKIAYITRGSRGDQ